jgi:hypothetical protein
MRRVAVEHVRGTVRAAELENSMQAGEGGVLHGEVTCREPADREMILSPQCPLIYNCAILQDLNAVVNPATQVMHLKVRGSKPEQVQVDNSVQERVSHWLILL